MHNDEKKTWKIILGILAAISVIVAFALFIQNNNQRAAAISMQSLKDATLQNAQRIDDVLTCAENELILTADLYEEMLGGTSVTEEDLQTLAEKSPFDCIEFVGLDGTDINALAGLGNVEKNNCYREGIKGNTGIDVVFPEDGTDDNMILFYTPLYNGNEIIGVLLAHYGEFQIKDILKNSFFDEESRTFLCMKDGSIIAGYSKDSISSNIFDKGNFNKKLSFEVEQEMSEALLNGSEYEFQYEGTGGVGSAYVTSLENHEWMLVQTFPSQVTNRFVKNANKAGMALLAELVVIFVICILAVQIVLTIQKKRLILENTEKSYVVNGITQLFGTFVLVDLEKESYRYLAGTKPRVQGFPAQGKYADFKNCVLDIVKDEEQKQYLATLFCREKLQKELDKDTPYLRYECKVEREHEKWDSINIICLRRVNGMAVELLFTYQDVTQVKQWEQQSYEALKEAYEAVENANHAKSNFLSNMSHDIRTPMNAIMGMTAIAVMNLDNPERVKDCLNKIGISSRHLLGLINEVLDMSKIESGKLVLTEEEFSLSEVVDHVINIFLPQTQAKQQQFNITAADITHEEVIGDSMRLQQIFINILGNAVKFTQNGGTITFSIRETPSNMYGCGCYVFTFEDNGIGMEESFIENIFEPFARADNSRLSKVEGTGLGMPIVKNIVQMMNGDIQVESRLNEGSKFTVTLYLKLNSSKHEDVEQLKDLSVLVADDDEYACESACNVLNEIGMHADYVLSGDEAVIKLVKANEDCQEYAVVILDWKMPGKDGIETAREIRKKVGDKVPIIILSAFDYSEIEEEAREAGVNAFISKPLFRSRLVYVMKALVDGEIEESTELDKLQAADYSGKRVLIVEDNELNMEIAEELLLRTGVTVEKAENGEIAVNLLRQMPENYFDIVFMDIQMPKMNGYEATREIRKSGREDLKTLPIIAMSADAFSDDVRHAEEAGMNGHIAKPVEIEKLLHVFEEWF
jgi:signal transduction histidine kinase/DNA-binding response OmpR family regulator